MATVTGTLDLESTTFSVTLNDPPETSAHTIRSGRPKFITTNADGYFETELDAGIWRVAIPHTEAFLIDVPTGSAFYDLEDITTSQQDELHQQLIEWTLSEAFAISSVSYDVNGIMATASVTWPDETTGVWTTTEANTDFLVPDAFTITYVKYGVTTTVTQSTVTRDEDGNVTDQPLPTVE